MKKILALVLAMLMLAGCGNAAPAETDAMAENPAAIQTAEETQEPEPPAPDEVITGAEECMAALQTLGYIEFNPAVYTNTFGPQASVTPVSMEITGDSFVMQLDVVEFHTFSQTTYETQWTLYGTKGDSLEVIPDLEGQGYDLFDTSILATATGDCVYDSTDYTFYRLNDSGKAEAMAFVTGAYYPATGNLYSLVQEFTSSPEEYATAVVYAATPQEYRIPQVVQTLQWGEFTYELKTFAIRYGNKLEFYTYREGMSFSDWACSELNTAGFIPWYDDSVLSPDRAYIGSTGYLAMEAWGEEVLTMEMQPFDGQLDHTYMYSFDVMGDAAAAAEAQEYLRSEEVEIRDNGSINVPVAHMVNARTPLFTPGFRIIGREEGRAAYHSTEIGQGLYLQDDILDIYMNGIDQALIPHIKLYAFPEPEEFVRSLEGQLILNAHTGPHEQGSHLLQIPEDAVCLTFQRVPNGQEAPNSPNPLRPGHENLNHNAVYARYVTKDDPNFAPGVNLAFAITFDDELVYWIHMGANFQESVNIQRVIYAMGY